MIRGLDPNKPDRDRAARGDSARTSQTPVRTLRHRRSKGSPSTGESS